MADRTDQRLLRSYVFFTMLNPIVLLSQPDVAT
jgi:hypothetical protein